MSNKKLNIVSIGGAAKILANFNKNLNLYAIDTNSKNLETLPSFVQKIQLGNGDGSGGDPAFAASLFTPEKVEAIFDCQLLILIAGLGGGTGSGITPLIANLAKEKQILSKIICFSPLVMEGSKQNASKILAEFQRLGLPITLIDNQEIWEKTPDDGDYEKFWETADFGPQETIKAIKSILESSNIDFKDVEKVLNYGGHCYSNVSKGTDFDSAFTQLQGTTTLDPASFQTAKGFLLNFKIGKSGMSKGQMNKIHEFVQFVQSQTKADLKHSSEMVDSDEFEITIFVSGIGTQIKVDANYSKIVQEKQAQYKADYISAVRAEAAKKSKE